MRQLTQLAGIRRKRISNSNLGTDSNLNDFRIVVCIGGDGLSNRSTQHRVRFVTQTLRSCITPDYRPDIAPQCNTVNRVNPVGVVDYRTKFLAGDVRLKVQFTNSPRAGRFTRVPGTLKSAKLCVSRRTQRIIGSVSSAY